MLLFYFKLTYLGFTVNFKYFEDKAFIPLRIKEGDYLSC